MSSYLLQGVSTSVPVISASDRARMRYSTTRSNAVSMLAALTERMRDEEKALSVLGMPSRSSEAAERILQSIRLESTEGSSEEEFKEKERHIKERLEEAKRLAGQTYESLVFHENRIMKKALQDSFVISDSPRKTKKQPAGTIETRLSPKEREFLDREFRARIRFLSEHAYSNALQKEASRALAAMPVDVEPVNARILAESLEKRNRLDQNYYNQLRDRYTKADVMYEFLTGRPFENGSEDVFLTEALCDYLDQTVIELMGQKEREQILHSFSTMLRDMGMEVCAERRDRHEVLFDVPGVQEVKGSITSLNTDDRIVISRGKLSDRPDRTEVDKTMQFICNDEFGRKIMAAMPSYGLCFTGAEKHEVRPNLITRKEKDWYDWKGISGTISFDSSSEKSSGARRKQERKERKMYIA